jgi:hypothetical protein
LANSRKLCRKLWWTPSLAEQRALSTGLWFPLNAILCGKIERLTAANECRKL